MRTPRNQRPGRTARHPIRLMAIALVTVVLLAIILVGGLVGFRVNLTPSAPLGLWRIKPLFRPPAVGDLVILCPPQTAEMQAARTRGYLRRGLCPGAYAPLIKRIAATAGARIVIHGSVIIDDVALPGSAIVHLDGKGRPLTPYDGGRVPAGSVFLYSGFAGSYDSRYFGPVPASGILGLAEEVLTYAP
jgi:conjugative transfer signal peptidase TraF